jgi:Flp pilus assembly protein TadD
MTDALAVHPLLPQAWYLKGLACIHLEEWNEGLQCFTRCVQQDMEIGEAWGNMGAIYMRMGKFENAYVALVEARKQKRESFQVLENMMGCALALKRYFFN